jgi:Co/Zn/Cd efflux system component
MSARGRTPVVPALRSGHSSGRLLAGVALAMLIEVAMRLRAPWTIHYDEALVAAVLGFAMNVVCLAVAGEGRGGRAGAPRSRTCPRRRGMGTIRICALRILHVLADAQTSIAAILALLAGKWAGMSWLDPVIAAAGGVLILRWAWLLVRDSASVLLGDQDDGVLRDAVHAATTAHQARVLDERLWVLASGRHALVLCASPSAQTDADALHDALEALPSLSHVTLDIIGNGQSSVALQQTL